MKSKFNLIYESYMDALKDAHVNDVVSDSIPTDATILEAGFETIKDCFIHYMREACDLIEKNFSSKDEQEEFLESSWEDFGDDIEEFLYGTIDNDDGTEDENKLLNLCHVYDMVDAIKANSEGIFGQDITSYLEN